MSNKIRLKWWVDEALRDTKSKVFFVTGGLGAGKTDGGSTWHYDRVTKNPKSQFSWFFEPTYKKVEDAGVPTYTEVLGRLGLLQGRHYTLKKSPNYSIKFRATGQEVHFLSYDRPDLIVATEISHAYLDEAADAEFLAYMNIRSRIRDAQATCRQLMAGGAPQGLGWFSEIADSDTLQGWDTTIPRDHTLKEKGYRRFTLWTDDNADNLPEDYIDILEDTYGHNPNYIKSYRFGVFCPFSIGSVYSNYRPYHDIENIPGDPYKPIDLTFDFNANPLAWVALQKVRFQEAGQTIHRHVAIDEANEGNTNLDDSIVEFALKFPVALFRDTPITLHGDRSGHAKSHKIKGTDYELIEKYLRDAGYRNIETAAARQVVMEVDSVEAVQKLFAKNLLYICKRCVMLRKSLLATMWKEGQRKIAKPNGETHTHHGDALKYWAWLILRELGAGVQNFGTNRY